MTMFTRPVSAWRYESTSDEVGTLLPPELLAEEAAYGPTAAVVQAYAEALAALLGDDLRAITPLGFARGRLTAAVIEEPVFIPGIEYVQTYSADVCRLYAPHVTRFKVGSESALEALIAAPGVVSCVDVVWAPRNDDIDAPFEVRWENAAPAWFHDWRIAFLVRIAPLGNHHWVCWDLDHRKVVSVRETASDGVVLDDIFPSTYDGGELRHDGNGWAATAATMDGRAVAARDRQFFACTCDGAPELQRELLKRWEGGEPYVHQADHGHLGVLATLAFNGATAELRWIGNYRVLRLRDGRVEQLTRDHDIQWAFDNGEFPDASRDEIARFPTNVIIRALPQYEPETATVDVAAGDRFVLLHRRLHDRLVEAAPDLAASLSGPVDEVARWARSVAMRCDESSIAVFVDADAHAAWRKMPPLPNITPTHVEVTSLVHDPQRFADKRIRSRGVLHSGFERMQFADAWFRCHTPLPAGAWLVDVEGTWRHGGRYGHLGMSKAELIGSATLVPIDRPRVVRPDDAKHERKYVPLRTNATLRQTLQGWWWDDRQMARLGADARFPPSERQQELDVELTYMIDGWRTIGAFSWRILAVRPVEPKPVELSDPLRLGDLVKMVGFLSAPVWNNDGRGDWPLLGETWRVIPRSIAHTANRYAAPQPAALRALAEVIQDGLFVEVIAEVARDHTLWATQVLGARGGQWVDVDIL